ncbi:hypothetical protein LINPERHAP1_LOCUS16168 [Linum perenne]
MLLNRPPIILTPLTSSTLPGGLPLSSRNGVIRLESLKSSSAGRLYGTLLEPAHVLPRVMSRLRLPAR